MRRRTWSQRARYVGWGLSLAAATPALAVITNSPTGAGRNTDAPAIGTAARTAWDLQGDFGPYLGTPVGPNHFMTAAHFDPGGGFRFGTFNFQGTAYSIDQSFGGGGFVNVTGQGNASTDLRIWKINGAFPSHAQLYSASDEAGKTATIIGRGTQRGDVVTDSGGVQRGWYWGPSDSVRSWGQNVIDQFSPQGAYGESMAFSFTRNGAPGAVANEGALSNGDSGGAVFITDASTGVHKLAAINLGVDGPFSLSPDGSNPFYGAIYDRRGLYRQTSANPNLPWTPFTGVTELPMLSYSTRVSPHVKFIWDQVQTASLTTSSFTAVGDYTFGDVNVTGTLSIGNGTTAASMVANHVRAGTLRIRANNSMTIRPNGTDAGVSKAATNLEIDPTAVLDLTDNAMVVGGNIPLSAVRNLIKSARNTGSGGLWTGKGITSSTARNNSLFGLAVISNFSSAQTPLMDTFRGQSVSLNDELIAYTYNGDSDLDGIITADDYHRLDKGYLAQTGDPRFREYRWGDFNYDGVIDSADYDLINASFFAQNPLATEVPSSLFPAAAVPEPAVTALAGLALGSLLARRRRRR